jgi:hypothetical protein
MLGFVEKVSVPWMDRRMERKPRRILPAVNRDGSA